MVLLSLCPVAAVRRTRAEFLPPSVLSGVCRLPSSRIQLGKADGFAQLDSNIASRANRIRLVVLKNHLKRRKLESCRAFAQDELARLREDEFALLSEVLSHL